MEHQTAKDMNAAEKYVLGELAGQERDQFEEHYFDCADCALDVQTAAAFVAASKEIFLEKPENQLVASGEKSAGKRSRWAGWLKPLIAIPAMAALIVMLGYEARQIKQKTAETRTGEAEQQLVASADFGLRGGDREASESVAVQLRAGQAFGLHFDFIPSQNFAKYVGEIQDQAGRALIRWSIPAERINKEVKFVVASGRLAPGNYALVILGDGEEQGQATKVVVAKYAFTVEIIR
jgi:Putative zinc-finger